MEVYFSDNGAVVKVMGAKFELERIAICVIEPKIAINLQLYRVDL